MEWPESFYALRRGQGCPMCVEGRPEETESGMRFFAGDVADAYLQKEKVQRGYSVVIWRGRHVAEPTELSEAEAGQYWLELLEAGRRLERSLQPVKINYEILGNSLPHLHTHIIPRYADDPRPGWPFPFPDGKPGQLDEAKFRSDLGALRS